MCGSSSGLRVVAAANLGRDTVGLNALLDAEAEEAAPGAGAEFVVDFSGGEGTLHETRRDLGVGLVSDALEARPGAPVAALGAEGVCAGCGLAKGRRHLFVMTRVHKACERELGRALTQAKEARVLDIADRIEAAYLAVDEFDVGDAGSAHRCGDEGLARAGTLKRLDLWSAEPLQFGVHAGQAVTYVAEYSELPLAFSANICGRCVARCKA